MCVSNTRSLVFKPMRNSRGQKIQKKTTKGGGGVSNYSACIVYASNAYVCPSVPQRCCFAEFFLFYYYYSVIFFFYVYDPPVIIIRAFKRRGESPHPPCPRTPPTTSLPRRLAVCVVGSRQVVFVLRRTLTTAAR